MTLPQITLPTRPKGLRFEVSALADPRFVVNAEAATIDVFDVIGAPGVTDARIAGALRSIGPKPVRLLVNSPGGDPFTGASIYNLLRGHGQPITTEILGMAASAASIVAMAGDQVLVARNGQAMIHRAQGMAFGDADTMRTVATLLDQTDAAMAGVYQARTGLPLEQIVNLMAAETFMSADELVALGFADGLLPRDADPPPRQARAEVPANKRDLEARLRTLGLSKSQAARAASASWPIVAGEPDEPDLSPVLAALRAQSTELAKLTTTKEG